MKEGKEELIEEQCTIIDKEITVGNSKTAYSTIKTLTKTSQHKASVISDAESAVVLKRWTDYCSDLYNFPLQQDLSLL